MDDAPAVPTVRGLKSRRIFEVLEIVFVRAIPDIHFGLETLTAFLAVLPPTWVPFMIVRATECIAVMIAVTGIPCVREKDVLLFVSANPIATASRPSQWFRGRATQATAA